MHRFVASPALLFFVVFFLFTSGGCHPSNRPKELPKLYPCSITITQEGKPLAEVSVTLLDDVGRWAVGGTTGDDGKAEMKTHGQFPGAPAGEYVVVLEKAETESDGEESPIGGISGGTRVYSLVEPQYTEKEKSPLKITVQTKSTGETFEIGPAKRHLLKEIRPGGY